MRLRERRVSQVGPKQTPVGQPLPPRATLNDGSHLNPVDTPQFTASKSFAVAASQQIGPEQTPVGRPLPPRATLIDGLTLIL